MKKILLIIGGVFIVLAILTMSFGIQIGNVRIGKQDDTLGITQKIEIENSNFSTEYLESDNLIVINLWATWCKPCIEEMPLLNETKQKYSNRNINFISLSVDTDSVKLSKFLSSKKFEFEDITLKNLEYRTAILNYLNNKPTHNKINSYSVPITYLVKNKKIVKTFDGGFENKEELTIEIDKLLK